MCVCVCMCAHMWVCVCVHVYVCVCVFVHCHLNITICSSLKNIAQQELLYIASYVLTKFKFQRATHMYTMKG